MKRLPYLLALITATGCGWPGAPLPPALQLPKPVTDLKAARKGDKVYLTWTPPTRTTQRQPIHRSGSVRVCRTVALPVTDCAAPIATVPQPPAPMPSDGKPIPTASYIDTLPVALTVQNATALLSYAVIALNDFGRAAGPSNQVQIPAAPTLPPPPDFRGALTREGLLLSWDCPTSSAAEVDSHIEHFLRIYRRQGGSKETKIADVEFQSCWRGAQYAQKSLVDRTLDWEKTYRYRAAVVSQVRLEKSEPCPVSETPSVECRATAEVEGDDTPPVQVFAHDVYPPAVPAGLQAVGSGAGQAPFIDLIWSPVTDSDLAGYNVYRSQPGGPSARINSGLVAAPAYRDASAKPGIRYSYSVSAVDVRGNESARSEDASEAVP